MMDEKVFQKIFDEVEKLIRNKWDYLVVYLEYGEASYSFSFYVKADKSYVNGFELPGVSEEMITSAFAKIDKLISKERKKNQEKWTNMTMMVSSDGLMHTDFDYTDLSEGTYQFKKNWKKKYLV